MLPGVARLKMHRVIVLVVVRCESMMLVYSEPVMVLGMIVIGIRVNMQQGDLARATGQDKSEQDRYEALHYPECM